MFKYVKKFFLFILPVLISVSSYSQFYNGHRMSFGKSRVQYNNFIWKFYRYEKFDSYFYQGGIELSQNVAKIAEKQIPELEDFFGQGLKDRIIFLCFNNLSDFRQSNIGYDTDNEQTNTGGLTQIIGNKIFIYSEGDITKLEKQVRKGIAQILINELLYGGNFRQKITNSTLLNLPEWYVNGLISYLTEDWNIDIENRVKDGFESGEYDHVNHLTGTDATIAGHSIWYFIAQTNGKEIIPNILYLTKVNKNPDSGFMYRLGTGIKQLSPLWKTYFIEKFQNIDQNTDTVSEHIVRGKDQENFTSVKYSTTGEKIAYSSNRNGKLKIYIFDIKTRKKSQVFKEGHRLERVQDLSYPLVEWHPNGKLLTFIIEEEGKIVLYTYNTATEEITTRNIQYLDKVLSYAYSEDGFNMVISGVKNSYSDIYIFNLAAGTFDNITNDNPDDFNPVFIENDSKIVFSSNRANDTIYADNKNAPINQVQNLFIFDIEKKKKTFYQLTDKKYSNQMSACEIKDKKFLFLSDRTGIINTYTVEYDSTVAFIDTSIHYRYFNVENQISNYNRNIEYFDYDKQNSKISEIFFNKTRFNISGNDFFVPKNKLTPYETDFIKSHKLEMQAKDSLNTAQILEEIRNTQRIDSIRKNPPKDIVHPDSLEYDINNYVFETDSKLLFYDVFPLIDSTENQVDSSFLQQRNYLTNFYTDYMMQQVDLGFLNSSYQAFTGDAFYFNPGMNIFMKIGVFDLFEDYRVTGGVRIGGNADSYEFLVSVEDLKKRWDKKYIYHRQTFMSEYTDNLGYPFYGKIFTNEIMQIAKYPFSEVLSYTATTSLRHDKSEVLSTDYSTLIADNSYRFFLGIKNELIFDNIISRGLNINEGARFKVFGEFYQEVDQKYTNLFVLGGDFRYYQKIHRSLIFAGRFAASSSFGKSKLIYYLGGVDNWYTFSPEKIMFDKSVNINNAESYVYQAVATNMRGFVQNVRNGTNFFVINAELRFPIIRYFADRPLNSEFLNNFQIVGFTDVGSAWSGLTPASPKNAYTTETVEQGSITVIIDKNRAPVVLGYGFGLRSRLFGYFFRLDWARGVERDVILPRIFYFSLNLDF